MHASLQHRGGDQLVLHGIEGDCDVQRAQNGLETPPGTQETDLSQSCGYVARVLNPL